MPDRDVRRATQCFYAPPVMTTQRPHEGLIVVINEKIVWFPDGKVKTDGR